MITATFRWNSDELLTATLPQLPAVGDEVIVPGHVIAAWTVTGRRWYLPNREQGPGQLLAEVWLTPC